MEEEQPKKYDEATLNRYRNLKMFHGKTDDEIVAYLENRPPKPDIKPDEEHDEDVIYDRKFRQRFTKLREDYFVDINDSNDVETLRALVRVSLQLEEIDKQFRKLQKLGDTRELKNLSDVQRALVQSVNDLQDKLGINRRQRKEKQVDDIPQYIGMLRERARTIWERETIPIRCEKCQIELSRYWLNFPKKLHKISFEGECWKCGEMVIFNR